MIKKFFRKFQKYDDKQRILRNSSKSKFKNYVSWIKEDLEEDTKMKYEIYPVIAANTSHIHLNERMSLLEVL